MEKTNDEKKDTQKKNDEQAEKQFKYIGTKVYVCLMLVVVCVFSVAIYSQFINKLAAADDVLALKNDLAQKNKLIAEYTQQLDQMYTDQNIEKQARSMGLVKDGEIIYKVQDEQQ